MKMLKWNTESDVVKDIRYRFNLLGLSLNYLSDRKIWKLYLLICDFAEYQNLTFNKAVKKIKQAMSLKVPVHKCLHRG